MHDPVPPLLRGAWRRVSIVNDDGTVDTTSTVVWLQLESAMVDVRIPANLGDADRPDLAQLATCEASSGDTTCSDVVAGEDGVRRATAEWHTRGPDDLAIHPVSAYPEPGLLEWNADGTVMVERAPSGAYVEEWHRLPGTEAPLGEHRFADGTRWYVAGRVAVFVRDERTDPSALADVEFSICEPAGDGRGWRITASTLPWRRGEVLDVDLR
ncbi:MAG: hypothetical protein AAGE98_10840 [Actinomycetota bacterium]